MDLFHTKEYPNPMETLTKYLAKTMISVKYLAEASRYILVKSFGENLNKLDS